VRLLVGVGNKAGEYDAEDLACVQAIADHAWALILQQRAIVALRLSERQLQDLQALATICVWQWDPEERVLACDGNLRRIFAIEALDESRCGIDSLLRFIDTRDHTLVLDALRNPLADSRFDLEIRGVTANGNQLTLHFRGSAYPRSQGHGLILRGILQDITEHREIGRIRYQANHDALTGLANRAALLAALDSRMRHSKRHPNDLFAIHYLDLDRFKPVNDRFGHAVGDQVLKSVASRLLLATRKEDLVARLGGDELVIVQANVMSLPAAEALAGKLIAAIEAPMEIEGHRIEVGASVGIALYAEDAGTADELLQRADQAMYQAKRDGGGGFSAFRLPAGN
jgi:diguanylate cyclase (GGDEF)-like protein